MKYNLCPSNFRDKECERKLGVAYETAQPRPARGSARREGAENCFIYSCFLKFVSGFCSPYINMTLAFDNSPNFLRKELSYL